MNLSKLKSEAVKKIVLETLLEVWNDTHSYPEEGDDVLTDLIRTVEEKLLSIQSKGKMK